MYSRPWLGGLGTPMSSCLVSHIMKGSSSSSPSTKTLILCHDTCMTPTDRRESWIHWTELRLGTKQVRQGIPLTRGLHVHFVLLSTPSTLTAATWAGPSLSLASKEGFAQLDDNTNSHRWKLAWGSPSSVRFTTTQDTFKMAIVSSQDDN